MKIRTAKTFFLPGFFCCINIFPPRTFSLHGHFLPKNRPLPGQKIPTATKHPHQGRKTRTNLSTTANHPCTAHKTRTNLSTTTKHPCTALNSRTKAASTTKYPYQGSKTRTKAAATTKYPYSGCRSRMKSPLSGRKKGDPHQADHPFYLLDLQFITMSS